MPKLCRVDIISEEAVPCGGDNSQQALASAADGVQIQSVLFDESSRERESVLGRGMQRYKELQQYDEKYGDCHVPPTKWEENPQLARWAINRRTQCRYLKEGRRSALLSKERISLLEEAGFVWSNYSKDNARRVSSIHGVFWGAVIIVLAILTFLPTCCLGAELKDVKVVVYQGPQPSECPPTTEVDKPTEIEPDHTVGLHFTATVDESSARGTPGQKIESSLDRGIATSFPVGRGKVIPGLDQGLIGLCKGSKAYIVIPPHLAYGDVGVPKSGLPGGVTLRYDVEIIDIKPPLPDEFRKIDANEDGLLSKDEARSYFSKTGKPIDVDALYADEDKDGDGFVSWEEFSGPKGEGPPSQAAGAQSQRKQHQQAPAEQSPPDPIQTAMYLFDQMDIDKDGKISRAELGKAFEAMGQVLTDDFWIESDVDGDGYVSLGEFVGSNDAGASSTGTDVGKEQKEEL